MVIIRSPFLGQTDGGLRKEDADDYADNVAEERCEEVSALRVVNYSLCDKVVHLYTLQCPNYGKEYPRPRQHDEDANQKKLVGGGGAD